MKFDISAATRLTENCNFGCRYCYVVKEEKTNIDFTTIENIIKKLLEHNDYYAHFAWIGGEPLLMSDEYFKEIINFSNKHNLKGLKISHSIETNGYLLNSNKRKFLQNLGFKVSVSYDGIKSIQNSLRKTKTKEDTHTQVIQNFSEADKSLGVISVITKLSCNNEEEIYNQLKAITKNASLNIYTPCGNTLNSNDSLLPSKKESKRLLTRFYELWRDDKSGFQLNPFSEIVRSFFVGNNNICEYSSISCYRILGINVDGNVYSCLRSTQIPDTCMGNINTDFIEDILNSNAHEAILDRYLKLKEDCCEYFNLCSGGCPIESLKNMESFNKRTYYCEAKKELFEKIEGDLKNDEIKRNLKSRLFG